MGAILKKRKTEGIKETEINKETEVKIKITKGTEIKIKMRRKKILPSFFRF